MIYAEFEQEWLERLQRLCPGSAKRIQGLRTQQNFSTCILPYIDKLLNSDEDIPINILRVFLMLLGNENASAYVSTLVKYQKLNLEQYSADDLSQWISAGTTTENSEYLISEIDGLSSSIFNLLILSKIVAIRPDLLDRSGTIYIDLLKNNPSFLKNVDQWRKRDPDKLIRKGFRVLEQWRMNKLEK